MMEAFKPIEVVYFAPFHPEGEAPQMNIIATNSKRKFVLINADAGRYTVGWDGDDVKTIMFEASTTNTGFMKIEADACNSYSENSTVTAVDFNSFNDYDGMKNLTDGSSVIVCRLTLFTKLVY